MRGNKPNPDSFAGLVRALAPGESAARVEILPDGATLAEIRAAKKRTHSFVTVAGFNAARAAGKTNSGRFSFTSGDYRALDGRTVCVATITRL